VEDHCLTLENHWLRVTILPYGATITSIFDKMDQRELVLGFDDVSIYRTSNKYFGCTIGRVANRISKGLFILNEEEYHLSINSGPNHLHGGHEGFDKKEFRCVLVDNSIECSYFSAHLEEGYPGNLNIKITYTLNENQLLIKSHCQSDRDTLVNLTNHTYFNLNDRKETVSDHFLEIVSSRVYPIDEFGCTFNQPFKVTQTPFDFTTRKVLSDCLQSDHPQVIRAKGLDHHFDINGTGLRLAARLTHQGFTLNVYTDKPGVHVYTGNYLNGEDIGYENIAYIQHSGICFETQYVPNSINFDLKIAPIVLADHIQEHQTIFEFVRTAEEVNHEH
jgi:aldose 1-epimerase